MEGEKGPRVTMAAVRNAFSRRGMLTLAILAGGARRVPLPERVIDVHVHANFDDPLLQWQAENLSKVTFTADGLAAEMSASGVELGLEVGFATEHRELSRAAQSPMWTRTRRPNLLPVGGINPYTIEEEALKRIGAGLESGELKGLKIYLGYYPKPPDDDAYKHVYEVAGKHGAPVILHTGDTYSINAKVRFAHPLPVDDVAVDFRQVNFVLAHLGNPWTIDSAELLYKNPNVYADLSGFLVATRTTSRGKGTRRVLSMRGSCSGSQERVDHTHGAVEPAMFKVFRVDFRKPVVLGIGPKVRVEPGELVGCGTP